jgi:16S rRNA (uracil1498-N3)-methyltransferase
VTPAVFVVPTDRLGGDRVVLDGAEGHHAARVRRVRAGERVDVTDGSGGLAECVVATVDRDVVTLDVVARRTVPEPAPRIVVAQALVKGDRGELAVEMLTEVGVDVIVPWAAARCVAEWRGERGDRALERWRAHAREAAKQARRARFPEVFAAARTPDVAALIERAALGVVLHESADAALPTLDVPPAGDVVLVVGPEGGITADELAAFGAAGAQVARLGDSVLRASTAGTAAAAVVLANSGRWR